jgi:hypothetical protein
MARVTIYDAWAVDVRSLPCGVTEATERRVIDSIDFDGDQCDFTEALADEGYTSLAALDWRAGRVGDGRAEYTVTVDGWVTYLAEVVDEAMVAKVEVAA